MFLSFSVSLSLCLSVSPPCCLSISLPRSLHVSLSRCFRLRRSLLSASLWQVSGLEVRPSVHVCNVYLSACLNA